MSAPSRRSALRELLSRGRASTQAELCALLAARGFEVTQSTVSRDLKRLGAQRTMSGGGVPVYRLGSAPPPAGLSPDMIVDITHNECMVVLRTSIGLAPAVGLDIDGLDHPDVLGTVAGNDTVLVVPRTVEGVERLARQLRTMAGR